jgi:hypothetical protein
MTKARFAAYIFAGLLVLALLPSLASAQSTISGQVRDTSGAVVVNATVEAASDVLIERVRSVRTNSEGRYAIVDLRPGTYVVTATATGFASVKQTIEVPANVTVPVDAEMKVGSVGETVNVEARVATVDVENVAHPETLTRAEMDALPTGRYMQSIASYVPGAHLNLPDIGGSQQIEQNYISVHGNDSVHDTYLLDGMIVNTTYLDGAIQQYIDNEVIQETTYQSSNATADVSGGGMMTNLVPKDGGNTFHLQVFAGGSGGSGFWQGDNLNHTISLRNCPPGSAANCNPTFGQKITDKIEDFDGSFGGPIIKDKLWFLLTGRDQLTYAQAGGSFYPDGKPGIQDGYIYQGSLRLTYQMNSKNKFSAFWLRNWKYKAHEIFDGGQEGYLPSDPSTTSTQRNKWPMYYILQTKWTGTLTPRLITEAGMSLSKLDYNDLYQPGLDQAPGTLGFYQYTTQRDDGTLLRFVAPRSNQHYVTSRTAFTGSAGYITGSHQIRIGGVGSFGPFKNSTNENGDGYISFVNGVPTSFTAINTPYFTWPRLDADIGLFAMDTWHFKRVAITAGIRWEYLAAEILSVNAPAGRFAPARNVPGITCDTVKGMGCWGNWAPRLGVVYDVFGNHKLALKAGAGKYNSAYATGFTNNFNPFARATETVPWTAVGANLPQCAPVLFKGIPSPNPNCFPTGGFNGVGAIAGAGAGVLGASPNPAFGAVASSTGIALDPNWHRDYNYQYNAGIQEEIARGVTLNFNWYRRSQYQQTLVENYAVPFSSWTETDIINPLDGSKIPFYGLSKAAGTPALYQTNAPQSLVKNVYTGYETSVIARLPRGMFAIFGWTVDRDLDRNCAATAGWSSAISGNRLNDPNNLRFCDMFGSSSLTGPWGLNVASLGNVGTPPWQNEFKVQGSLPIKWGIVGSASFYSNRYQGVIGATGYGAAVNTGGIINDGYLGRTWTLSAASTYPKNCVGCTPGAKVFANAPAGFNVLQGAETIELAGPGQVLTPRLNQLDVSLKRTFRFRDKYVIEPEIQAFNILNSSAAVTESVSLGGDATPFLPKSACGSSSAANCGVGGAVTTLTNPRLLRLALLFRF